MLQEGFKLLEGNECDVILGPAADGGYYTIGTSSVNTREHLGEYLLSLLHHEIKVTEGLTVYFFIGELFEGMDWGTERVLQQQVEAGESLGLKIKLLSQTLFDVVRFLFHILLFSPFFLSLISNLSHLFYTHLFTSLSFSG